MNSSSVPDPLQQSSDNLDLATCLFGYTSDKQITCVDDLFNHPKKREAFIGMQYFINCTSYRRNMFFCNLCNFLDNKMFPHVVSQKHKRKYLKKDFSSIFSDVESISPKVIDQIATIIEKVEGLQKVKVAKKVPTEDSKASDCSSSETLDKIVEQLQIHGIAFKNPSVNVKGETCRVRREFEQGKLQQSIQPAGKPIMLSRPLPDSSLGVLDSKNVLSPNSRQATKRSSTSDLPLIKDTASKRIPSFSQHRHPLGTMTGDISSHTGPTYSVPSLKQHTTSHYGSNSVNIKDLPSNLSSSPLGLISVLHQGPSLPKPHAESLPFEGLSPATARPSSCAQASQRTNSDMPVKPASMLSPQTLKILQGRDQESVKSILTRLSEYCPELQQVNISLLVDVLFEIEALR